MPRGTRILFTRHQEQQLRAAYKHEPNAFTRIRISSLLRIAEGETARELAPKIGVHEETLKSWARKYRKEGLAGLRLKPGRGKPKTLSVRQLEELKEWIRTGRVHTLMEVRDLIFKQYQKAYTKTGIWRLFKSLGISYDADRREWRAGSLIRSKPAARMVSRSDDRRQATIAELERQGQPGLAGLLRVVAERRSSPEKKR